jgi:CopG family nickel-responsive transcriptional regulator
MTEGAEYRKHDAMERVTISMSGAFAAELKSYMADHGYENRSEALRDLARSGLERARRDGASAGDCVATLSYVFDHHRRDLPKRLAATHHQHHDLEIATLHVHLDHAACLEVAVLRGPAARVRDFARSVIAESGVSFGEVSIVPATLSTLAHGHTDEAVAEQHIHVHPKL